MWQWISTLTILGSHIIFPKKHSPKTSNLKNTMLGILAMCPPRCSTILDVCDCVSVRRCAPCRCKFVASNRAVQSHATRPSSSPSSLTSLRLRVSSRLFAIRCCHTAAWFSELTTDRDNSFVFSVQFAFDFTYFLHEMEKHVKISDQLLSSDG